MRQYVPRDSLHLHLADACQLGGLAGCALVDVLEDEGPAEDPRVLQVYEHMNERAGRAEGGGPRFIHNRKGQGPCNIRARLKSGYTVEDLVEVFDWAYREWWHSPKMKPYVHPDTLYRVRKFQGYLDRARG